MQKGLNRYWFNCGKGLGIGVTAFTPEDAVGLIQNEPSLIRYQPKFDEYRSDINVAYLDQKHIVPNIGIISFRGVWFPNIGASIK